MYHCGLIIYLYYAGNESLELLNLLLKETPPFLKFEKRKKEKFRTDLGGALVLGGVGEASLVFFKKLPL